MAIQNLKFKEADFIGKDVSSLPDNPSAEGISATQLKARFDNIAKMMIALGKHNELIDALSATTGAGEIGTVAIGSVAGGTVQTTLNALKALDDANKAELLARVGECVLKADISQVLGNTQNKIPSEKAVSDAMANAGYGDMLKGVYDTNNNGKVDDAERLNGQQAAYYATKTEVTTAQTTANAALPKAGGTVAHMTVTGDLIANSQIKIASRGVLKELAGNLGLLNDAGIKCTKLDQNTLTPVVAAAFYTTSSERFKNILETMDIQQAQKILGLDFVKFTYKPEYNNDGEKIHYGIRAEQAIALGLSDLVECDAQGLPNGVDYSKLTPYLGAVVKDQERRINMLECVLRKKGILTQEETDALNVK